MANQALTLEQLISILGQPTQAAPAAPAAQPYTVEELQQIVSAVPATPVPPSPYTTQGRAGPGLGQLYQQTIGAPMQSVGRFLQGVGRGASFGLTDFPAAGALMATRALTGGAPLTTREALDEVKMRQSQAREAGPAYTLGALMGGTTTGGIYGLGRSLASTAARGGAMGAVSGGLSETPGQIIDPMGASIGLAAGVTGGALTAGVATGPKMAEKYVKNAYIKNQEIMRDIHKADVLAKDPLVIQKAKDQIMANIDAATVGQPAKALREAKRLKQEVQKMNDDEVLDLMGGAWKNPAIPGLYLGESLYRSNAQRIGAETKIKAAEPLSGKELYEKIAPSLTYVGGKKVKSAAELARESIPGITMGALSGIGAAALQGSPDLAAQYAAIGAGLGGAYRVRDELARAAIAASTGALARYPIGGPRQMGMVGQMTAIPSAYNVPGMMSGALTGGLAQIANLPQYDYRMLLGQ